MSWFLLIAALAASYLIGSIPFGYVVAKQLRGIDIRDTGSGNIGTTNVWRTLGPGPGIAVLGLDILKGVVAVALGRYLGVPNWELLTALAVLAGHSWPIFLSFRGGKIIATGAGVVLALSPVSVLVAAVLWLLAVGLTRYVSLGSILAAISIPVTMVILKMGGWYITFSIVVALFAVYKHRSNIERLLAGTENKVGKGRWR